LSQSGRRFLKFSVRVLFATAASEKRREAQKQTEKGNRFHFSFDDPVKAALVHWLFQDCTKGDS